MARWRSFYRGSIKRRFIALVTSALLLILAGAVWVLVSTLNITSEYDQRIQEMSHKQRLISEIASDTREVVMHFRGYLVYLTPYESEMVETTGASLSARLDEIKQVGLTDEERKVVQQIEVYMETYIAETIPAGSRLAEDGAYDRLRELVKADATNPTNDIVALSKQLEIDMMNAAASENDRLVSELSMQGIYFMIYIVLILLVSYVIVRRVATDINAPLSELSNTASRFARGEPVHFEFGARDDEIGTLSRSLDTMMITLLSKEDELVAQNEELLAQQDELQMQQEELQDALRQTEETGRLLEKRNRLVQALANTLEKDKLLASIIQGIVEITNADKGMIMRLNGRRDHAAYGISPAAAEQFMSVSDESMLVRVMASKRLHRVEREATLGEKGCNLDAMTATDLYVPILGDRQELMALLLLTKIGNSVTDAEEREVESLATQISLALVKLDMFEESEYQRQLNFDMLNTIQEAIQLVDVHGGTIHVNSKCYELLAIDPSHVQASGMRLSDFTKLLAENVTDSEALVRFIQRHFTGDKKEAHSMRYELTRPAKKYVQIYVEPLYRDGELFGKLLVHRDITTEYEVDLMKSEFVSTVSHELRTPLASVLGFAELLLHRELKPERQRKYIATIHQEAHRLTTLINDFLDLQRMESGKQGYEMKPMRLGELVRDVIERQQPHAAGHTITWTNEAESSWIFADRDKLGQVFMNLIGNSIKYSPHGGPITVTCRQEGNKLRVGVADAGLGIPAEAIPKLFDKFYRVDNSDRREIGGTGLGLAIVKEIVQRHKGSIEVASILGEGSCFTVTLPVYEPKRKADEEAVPLPEERKDAEEPHVHVMLIENDASLADMLNDELQENGWHVHHFAEGRSATAAMPDLMPDVVVIDLVLEPDYGGWEVIDAMRKDERLRSVPIVISSAYEEKELAAKRGIDDFLVKPFLPGKLTSTVRRLLADRSRVR